MIQQSRTILIFQYHCQNMMAALYFTWPTWTQSPPERWRVTYFYCEVHLLCMHSSHIGTPKYEHLPIMPTRGAECCADSKNCLLKQNNSYSIQEPWPSVIPMRLFHPHLRGLLRNNNLITEGSSWKQRDRFTFYSSYHHQVRWGEKKCAGEVQPP